VESRRTEDGYLVRLVPGEEVLETITGFLRRHAVASGTVTGIGALTGIELGFFRRTDGSYVRRMLTGEWELLALTGNMSRMNGEPFVHAHVVVGDESFRALGGHLFRGVVTVAAELALRTSAVAVERVRDPDLGFLALCLDPESPGGGA
jgi:predicted DNA-binding protein with PD1-like motif